MVVVASVDPMDTVDVSKRPDTTAPSGDNHSWPLPTLVKTSPDDPLAPFESKRSPSSHMLDSALSLMDVAPRFIALLKIMESFLYVADFPSLDTTRLLLVVLPWAVTSCKSCFGSVCHEQRVPSVVRTCPAWAVPSLIDILDASNFSSSAAVKMMSPSPLFSTTFVSEDAVTMFV
jgi:hypothetical protein